MYDATVIRNAAKEVLTWTVNGASRAEVTKYLQRLPNDYTEESLKVTRTYLEAMLAKYPDQTDTVCRVIQYVFPQYVCARLEGEDNTETVISKLINKYNIVIK